MRKTLVNVGGKPILERIVAELGLLVDERLALVHDDELPDLPGLRVLVDPTEYAGPMPALLHGLPAASGDVCLLVAGDMPFVSSTVFSYMLQLQKDDDADVVVPYIDGHIESMHAVFKRTTVMSAIEAAHDTGEQRLFKVFESLTIRRIEESELRAVDPDLYTLFNVNSPDELARAEQIALSMR